jgi:hypothetical protein
MATAKTPEPRKRKGAATKPATKANKAPAPKGAGSRTDYPLKSGKFTKSKREARTDEYREQTDKKVTSFKAKLEKERIEDPDTYAMRTEVEIVTNPNGTQRARRKYPHLTPPPGFRLPIPTTPENRKRKGPICGQPKSGRSSAGDGTCCMPAGMGTNHAGYGWCKYHGGNTHVGSMVALKIMMFEEHFSMYGDEVDITPGEALLQEVKRSAGHVAWLNAMINLLGDGTQPGDDEAIGNTKAIVQWTDRGVEPSVWINMYHKEREMLVRSSKLAIDAGVAERQVKIAEEQGMILAMIVKNILTDPRMQLTPEQQIAARDVVREHMTSTKPIEIELTGA